MPVHLRALVIIMALSLAVLYLMRRPITAHAIAPDDYKRRAASWIAITLLAFLTHNYWLFILISVPLIYLVGAKDTHRFALYLFLLFVVPPYRVELYDMGALQSFMQIDHFRWLSLALLLPAYLSLRRRPDTVAFGRLAPDLFVLGYILLWLTLQALSASFTVVMRVSAYFFLDLFLPYYVASRALRSVEAYRDALAALAMAVLLMAPIAVFEWARYWLLYGRLEVALGLPEWGWGGFLLRGDALRAQVTTGHAIVLGYCMAVGIGVATYLKPLLPKPSHWWLMMLTLCAGLVAGMSRGPWVGAAAALMVFVLTGPRVGSSIVKLGLLGLVVLPVLLTTKQGQKILDYLPFVGTVEAANVEFRQRLFDVSVQVLWNFPWFGALNYLEHPDMERMRGADGLIDMVNSFLAVAMATGLVGLTLFAAPFVLVMFGLLKVIYMRLDRTSEMHHLSRSLLATIVGIMVTIGTVSSITAVPIVYMAMLGMAVGYLRMVASMAPVQPARAPPPADPRRAMPRRSPPGSRNDRPNAPRPAFDDLSQQRRFHQ